MKLRALICIASVTQVNQADGDSMSLVVLNRLWTGFSVDFEPGRLRKYFWYAAGRLES